MSLPKVISHRGGRSWAPENTLAAFRMSLDIGVFGLELDVHRCASGELVVIHDEDINRTTNGVGLVKDVTYDELRRLDAGSWWDEAHGQPGESRFVGERIPLLTDVLALVDGKAMLNIEIKNTPVDYPGIEDDLLDALAQYKHTETVIVSSFDHRLMSLLHRKRGDLNIALLADALLIDMPLMARQMGATYWHPCFGSLRREAVEEAHQSGIAVHAWTINAQREWQWAVEWGIDGIITDDPLALTKYLQRQKQLLAQADERE
ncbi:MAG TPA: glycerophosphodiester phosphodiesterase family protein [Candidatus Obscuribacterales bacterium]